MADGGGIIDLDTFISLHQQQFQSIGLVNHLWEVLYGKIFPEEVHDVESTFEVRSEGKKRRKWSLHARRNLKKESDVFLIEHIWTSDGGNEAQKKLLKDAKLLMRMKDLLLEEEESDKDVMYLDKNEVVCQLAGVDANIAEEALKHAKGELIDAVSSINDGKLDFSNDEAMQKMITDKVEKKVLSFEEFKRGFLEQSPNKDISDEYIKKLYHNYIKESESESEEKEKDEKNGGTTLQYTWTEDVEGTITTYITIPEKIKKGDIVSKITVHGWEFGVKGNPSIIKGKFYSRVHPDECFWTFDSPGLMQVLIQKEDVEVSWPVSIQNK